MNIFGKTLTLQAECDRKTMLAATGVLLAAVVVYRRYIRDPRAAENI